MIPNKFLSGSRKIIEAYNLLCKPVLEKFDLPQVSFDILMFLTNNPAFCTAQEISEYRHIKKNLVSVHIEKLVEAGLVERSVIECDRRKIALSCTPKALPIINEGLRVQKEFYEALSQGITDEQWEIFKTIHDTIDANAQNILQSAKKQKGGKI